MGLRRFVMTYGFGSPGSIARAMARTYVAINRSNPGFSERELLRQLYLSRVRAAQSVGSRAANLGLLNGDTAHVEDVLDHAPNLASLVTHVIFMEHPELLRHPAAVASRDDKILDEVVRGVLDKHGPGWAQGKRLTGVSVPEADSDARGREVSSTTSEVEVRDSDGLELYVGAIVRSNETGATAQVLTLRPETECVRVRWQNGGCETVPSATLAWEDCTYEEWIRSTRS